MLRLVPFRCGRCGAASYVQFRWVKVRRFRVGSVEVGRGRYVLVDIGTLC